MDGLGKTFGWLLARVDLSGPTTGSIRSRALLSTLGVAMQGLLRFATTLLVGHLAGPSALGSVTAATATGTFLCLLWPTSAGTAASKYVARARGAQRWNEAGALAWFLGLRTVVAAVALAVVGFGWMALHGDALTGVWVAAFVLGFAGYAFVRGAQFGAGQVARATAWDVLTVVVALLALTGSLLAGVRSTALVLPIAGGYLVYALAGRPRLSRHPLPRPLRREVDHFLQLGIAGTLASSGFLQLSMIMAKAVDEPQRAGEYAAALNLATPPSLLAGSLSLVLFPAMAETWGRGDVAAFRRQTDRMTRIMALILIAVFGTLLLCHRLLLLVFPSRFAGAQPLLALLLFATLATSLAVPASNSLSTRSLRWMAVVSGANLCGLIVGAVIWWAATPSGGVHAVAVGYLSGALVLACAPVMVAWAVDRHRWAGLVGRLGLAVAALVSVLHLQDQQRWAAWTGIPLAVLFVVAWLLLSWRDARELLPALVRRGSPPSAAS